MPLPLICLSHELSHNVRLLCSVLAILNLAIGYYRSKQEAGEEDDAVKDLACQEENPPPGRPNARSRSSTTCSEVSSQRPAYHIPCRPVGRGGGRCKGVHVYHYLLPDKNLTKFNGHNFVY